MLGKIATVLGRLYTFLLSLVVALILSVATWGMWQYYQDVRLLDDFSRKARPVTVAITNAEQKQRSWQDVFSNSTYLTVEYQGKAYPCRFVMDSGYVGSGDRVKLLYHPDYDSFRQPRAVLKFDESNRKSRLIEWSSIRDFSPSNRLLLLCMLLSTASFFFSSGLIGSLIPIPFLQTIARFLFVLALGCAAIFFTYDTIAYFNYYQLLNKEGQSVSVPVLATNRKAHGRKYNWYTYEATVRHQGQERIVPISEDDFDALSSSLPGSVTVRYVAAVDDLMADDFTPDYWVIVVPLFFYLLVFLFVRPAYTVTRQR
ncbi:hypothetical protein [Spirosoma fluviale]|uniref:DUF3592 domain-containing protein n=1 Tax=Spirosoma fluviale TaxID=1597977 RepID=A0A286FFB2_9BACT|nr:hypothetical protein [Spirosoma fluviale]SOD81910.1 hypothetical protein SAMN06269250_1957 [Spirosoma fluviale]